jgi:hypothetical protein
VKRRSNPSFLYMGRMDCFACARNDGVRASLASWRFEN